MAANPHRHRFSGPVVDEIARNQTPEPELVGYARALHYWRIARSNRSSLQLRAPAQVQSLRLLAEWFEAKTQHQPLTQAAQQSLESAARQDEGKATWNGYASRQNARLPESTYHSHMFILFEFEFVLEVRQLLKRNPAAFRETLHHVRRKCSNLAGFQRVAHGLLQKSLECGEVTTDGPTHIESLFDRLGGTIPVCVHPCPWLHVDDAAIERPHFLWDVKSRRTVVVSQLPKPPEYVCVSHTWGRWRKTQEASVPIAGVGWLIPQNSKFEVKALPDMLEQAFGKGYIWFDLLCIPQDESELGGIEIARQAVIFRNAIAVVAWLNDVQHWDAMGQVVAWYALFYLHTNVQIPDDKYTIPDMPQLHEANYVGMELYDWTKGNASSIPVSDGKLVDEDMKIAPPMPWFTSLWTLQEVCLRPDLVLCDRSWRPLSVGASLVTFDVLVAFDDFISSKQFADSVTRPEAEKARDTSSNLPQIASSKYPTIARPPGCKDLNTLLIDTQTQHVMTLNAAAVLTFGQFRECTSRRAEAIMAVTGDTDWYVEQLRKSKRRPPEENLVLGLYPLPFVQEAARKTGPAFFTSLPTELRYLSTVVDLQAGVWRFRADNNPASVGSMLPFSREPGFLVPPTTPTQQEYGHPSVETWQIQQDGSIMVRQAGILQLTSSDQVEAIVYAPLYDENDQIHYDTSDAMVDGVDLGGWLEDFSDPQNAPNYAVSLYQFSALEQGSEVGLHTGLLLKLCAEEADGKSSKLVKVGLFFTKAMGITDVPPVEVDWVIL